MSPVAGFLLDASHRLQPWRRRTRRAAAAPGACLERDPRAKESLSEPPAVTARGFFYDALVFDPLGTLEKCGLDAAVLAAIRAGNARRFLGL